MIDANRLRGIIAERGESQRSVAKALGISEASMYNKMAKGVFGSNEIEGLVRILRIPHQDIPDIFFPN